jgi:hypothetical protein
MGFVHLELYSVPDRDALQNQWFLSQKFRCSESEAIGPKVSFSFSVMAI